jgi:hypothetical protein
VVEPVEASTSMIEAARGRKHLRAPDVSGTPSPLRVRRACHDGRPLVLENITHNPLTP